MGWGSTEARRYFPKKQWNAEVLGWRHDFEFTNLRSLPFFWGEYRGYDVGLNLVDPSFRYIGIDPIYSWFARCQIINSLDAMWLTWPMFFHAIFELNLCSAYRYIQDSSNQMVSENSEIMNKGIQILPSRIHSWSLFFWKPSFVSFVLTPETARANLCPSTSKWVSYHQPYSACIYIYIYMYFFQL